MTLWFKYYLDISTFLGSPFPKIPPCTDASPLSQIGKPWGHLTERLSLLFRKHQMIFRAFQAEKCFELYLQYVNHQQRNNWVGTILIIKGCVRYILLVCFLSLEDSSLKL